MTFGTLHAWYVAMRGLLLSPFPGRPLLQVVHRRAETGGAERERRCLRTAALPSLPLAACASSLFVCCLFVVCMTAGRGATEVHGCYVPAPVLFSISNLLRVACFLLSVFFGAFYLTQSSAIKRNSSHTGANRRSSGASTTRKQDPTPTFRCTTRVCCGNFFTPMTPLARLNE